MNNLYFGPNFISLETALGCFSHCFFYFCRRSIMKLWFTQPPTFPTTIKKLPTALDEAACSSLWMRSNLDISQGVIYSNQFCLLNSIRVYLAHFSRYIPNSIHTLQFQIIVPRLLIFVFLSDLRFLIWTPTVINFPDFVLEIFQSQRFFKLIILFVKLQAV